MFPRLRQQLLARADLLVELSTLGEYGIDERGGVMRLDAEPAGLYAGARVRDRCAEPPRARQCATARSRAVRARP